MKYFSLLSLILCFITLLPNFLPYHLERLTEPSQKLKHEVFDPELAENVKSLEDIEKLLEKKEPQTLEYWNDAAAILRERFYHGFSAYALNENWIAAFMGYVFSPKIYFQSIVLPEDILKYPMAGCSQQGIVLQTLFKRKGIDYKTVAFNHHYAVAAFIEGRWYFFDTNIEPVFINGRRPTLSDIEGSDYLKHIYPNFSSEEVERLLGNPNETLVNPFLAPNMTLFHKITYFLSKTLWILFFLCFAVLVGFHKKRN